MTEERDTAKKIVALLNDGVSTLDDDTRTRLAAAREQAVAAMAVSLLAAPAELAHAGMGHSVRVYLHGRGAWMSLMAVLALLLMLLAVSHRNTPWDPVDTDALLLASDLPPEAYLDKGFDAWLENSSQP